jgi:hypothetical protein
MTRTILEILFAALIATVVFTNTIPAYAREIGGDRRIESPDADNGNWAAIEAIERSQNQPVVTPNCGTYPSGYAPQMHCWELRPTR